MRVSGLSSTELNVLAASGNTSAAAFATLHMPATSDITIAATFTITQDGLDVVPTYPLDPGRSYVVRLDPARLPTPRAEAPVVTTLTMPAAIAGAATTVSGIFPSSTVWPENTLRFYLHFSGPMGGSSAVGHVRLVDAHGEEIEDVLLEIDVDLWNTDYTRRTVFFDPGRVKRGIRPNRELGRALVAGQRYAIVVGTTWKDADGRPLSKEFRHDFTAGPAVEVAVTPTAWSIGPAIVGTRDPVVVEFPWSLDEGLLHRALGVTTANGTVIDGAIAISDDERRWTFTPARTWEAVAHSLVVLTLLEDPAGNRVGEPFEFEMFGTPVPDAERVTLPIPKR